MRAALRAIAIAVPALLVLGPGAIGAQTPADRQIAAPDPARLAAAKAMVETVMPAAQREAMIDGIIKPTMANVRETMLRNPELSDAFRKDARAKALLDRFIESRMADSLTQLHQSFPALMQAMTISYARHLTVEQLDAARAFYASPAGRALTSQLPQIMSDPAIASVQRQMMADAMARMPEALKQFREDLAALAPAGGNK